MHLHGPVVYLKERRAKPLFMQHPWVFSGAVERVEGQPQKGAIVSVADANGTFIGRGMYNPDSQIVVRLLTWHEDEPINDAFWRRRIEAAARLRQDVLRLPDSTDAFRMIHSEADGLPGLIVDRYADFLVVQFLTAGMAECQELLLDLLMEVFHPRGIYDRSDDESAAKEGIAAQRGLRRGAAPDGTVEIHCDRMRFLVDIAAGQKTGFFLDQRENRLAAARYMKGRRVLDAFCYTGGFSVAAALLGGAASVLALDRSAPAIEMAQENFRLNGLTNATAQTALVAEALRELKKSGQRFDAVILDPPRFAKSRPGVPRALRAYRDVNLLAMQLLEDDGILVTCSCSGHVSADEFTLMLNDAAVEAGVTLQLLERRGQSADHPVIASCPETGYLKCFIGRVARCR